MPTLNPEFVKIKSEIDKVLDDLVAEKGNELVSSIQPILYTNLDRDRVKSFTDGDGSRIHDYVRRVADNYVNQSTLMKKLQLETATEAWEPVLKNLLKWAYVFLLRKNFVAGTATYQIAEECANTAAMTIVNAYFPYDVDFERWACVIVQNICRKFIRNESKKSAVPQQNIVELNETLSTLDDPILIKQKYQEDKSDILKAMAELSDARRKVIEFYYFDELSPSEIAIKMRKTVSAVYSLHFNALKDLQKILQKTRNSL